MSDQTAGADAPDFELPGERIDPIEHRWFEIPDTIAEQVPVKLSADDVRAAFAEAEEHRITQNELLGEADTLDTEIKDLRAVAKSKRAAAEESKAAMDAAMASAVKQTGLRPRDCATRRVTSLEAGGDVIELIHPDHGDQVVATIPIDDDRLYRAAECPAARIIVDGQTMVAIYHPETGEELHRRELSDIERQGDLFAEEESNATEDEANSVDREQFGARLSDFEDLLSTTRGPLAVPAASEIERWKPGVALATQVWLDALEAAENADSDAIERPAPVWCSGFTGAQQALLVPPGLNAADQFAVLRAAMLHGMAPVIAALGQEWRHDVPLAERLAVAKGREARAIEAVALNFGAIVDMLKRHDVTRGTSAHLSTMLRVAAAFEGLPLLAVALTTMEVDTLRPLYYIAKIKAAGDGAGAEQLAHDIVTAFDNAIGGF